MLEVVCVNVGSKYPKKYVNILQAMVARNLTVPHRFVCLTDDPKGLKCVARPAHKSLPGWWSKMHLFKPGILKERTLYIDLDVVITGSLDSLVALDGFHIIADWNVGGYNSSVMLFDPADDVSHVWDEFEPAMMEKYHGDQDVITNLLPDAETFGARDCVSYKTHCRFGVPKDSKIVVFHGRPNPHELMTPWVKKLWRE